MDYVLATSFPDTLSLDKLGPAFQYMNFYINLSKLPATLHYSPHSSMIVTVENWKKPLVFKRTQVQGIRTLYLGSIGQSFHTWICLEPMELSGSQEADPQPMDEDMASEFLDLFGGALER